MPTTWKTYPLEFKGGLISNLSPLQHGMQLPNTARVLSNFEPSVQGGFRRIEGFQNLVNEVNNKWAIENEGEDLIKVSKKQVENFEMSRGETLAQQAGGFTPMVFEFAAASYLTGGVLNMLRIPAYLNKLKAVTYLTKNGKIVSGSNIATRAAKVNKSPKKYIDDLNKSFQKELVIKMLLH